MDIPGHPLDAEDYGICNLSVVPVRTEPSDKSEIGTQLLFGDAFAILKTSPDKKWVYIKNGFDDYNGWIDSKQYKKVSRDYFELVNSYDNPVCKDLLGLLQSEKRFFPILMGSTLPFYNNGMVNLGDETYTYQGEVIYPKMTKDPRFVEMIARYYLAAPYLWGGKNHFGIDCSGLVQQVYKISGYNLPRDAYQQAECGIDIPFDELKPADLAFFHNDAGRVTHVGIVLNNGQILHASGEVRIDSLDMKGIFNADRNTYTHKFHSIKRIID